MLNPDVQPVLVIVILTFNQREKTLQCLASVIDTQTGEHTILVWDNGSGDGSIPAVKVAYPQVQTRFHPENLGVAGGRNAAAQFAIEQFHATHLLFLDNDMLLEPGFIQALYRPFTENSKIGQTQAKLRFMHDRSRINDGGGAKIDFVFWQIKPVGYGEVDRGQYDTPKPCNSCGGAMLVRADVFQELGGFDESFNPFGPEDMDFTLRLQKLGYQAWYIPQAVAYHEVSHTFGKGYSEEYAQHKSRHWLHFMRRHASPWQKVAFYLIGAPVLTIRTIFREARRGNLSAIRGLFKGILKSG
jgi:GT2 family glycosyltransferase